MEPHDARAFHVPAAERQTGTGWEEAGRRCRPAAPAAALARVRGICRETKQGVEQARAPEPVHRFGMAIVTTITTLCSPKAALGAHRNLRCAAVGIATHGACAGCASPSAAAA
jgi:hypothetical protein